MTNAKPGTRAYAEREFSRQVERLADGGSAIDWTDHRLGFRSTCADCQHRGRTWMGMHPATKGADDHVETIRWCGPLCVSCAVQAERKALGLEPMAVAKDDAE